MNRIGFYLSCATLVASAAPLSLQDVWTDACRYAPGNTVNGSVVLQNHASTAIVCQLIGQVTHLGRVAAVPQFGTVTVPPGGVATTAWAWLPPPRDYTGYLISLCALADGQTSLPVSTAIDVSSDWCVFPRYGFLSSFGPRSVAEISAVLDWLNRYHLNGLQFYDWQNYKHHIPLAGTVDNPASSWQNVAACDTRFLTVTRYLSGARARRMASMNYNLLYGASADCYADGVQEHWGLYTDKAHTSQVIHTLPAGWATPHIKIFNPLHTDWRNWLFTEEEKVFSVFAFDGWHIDQIGVSGYSWEGNAIDMAAAYGSYVNAARARLGTRLVFNAINESGQPAVTGAVDFLYVETWPSNDAYARYRSFPEMCDRCRTWSDNRLNIVFAAYLNRTAPAFNPTSVLLADAAIFAAGGAHIELGDHGLLSNEYFPVQKPASAALMARLRSYYDVLTAYQNILRDRNVTAISRDVSSPQLALSTWDEPGRVWHFARHARNIEILHLINLTSLTTNAWDDPDGTYAAPAVISNAPLNFFTDTRVDRVLLVSPDVEAGRPVPVSFSTNSIGGRACVSCSLPSLEYWSMLLFCTEPHTYYISAAAQHTFDGHSLATAFRTIYEADQSIPYGHGDTILIDGGATNGGSAFIYDHGGPAGAVSRFQMLRDATNANELTIAGINGRPTIIAEAPPLQFHGVRYNCTVSNLAFVVSNGPAVVVANQRSYAGEPTAGASARWYPASGGNMLIAECVCSNLSASPAIVFGVNGSFDGREDADIHTVLKGARIVGNHIHAAGAGDLPGALRFNQYGGGADVLIAGNNLCGPGMLATGSADAITIAWNDGKDTHFVISNNHLHGWSGRALALDVGASELRENLVWDIGGPAVQLDGGVAGGAPNVFVNNTFWNINGNCVQTQYDSAATNWWVNNLFLRAAAGAYVCWSGGGAQNIFSACMSHDVTRMYNVDAAEAGSNYWYRDPLVLTTNRTSPCFLALAYPVSDAHALYSGAAYYGGKSWLGVGGGIQGGAPLDVPEPAGLAMLAACLLLNLKKSLG